MNFAPFAFRNTIPSLTGITFSGLTIYVNDAAASYPGTGTTWTSISTGTTYNGTLFNGPTWSGGTPGYFQFDGVDDYLTFPYTGSTTGSFTYGGWVNIPTGSTQQIIYMRGLDGSGNGWSLFIDRTSANKFSAAAVTTSPSIGQVTATGTSTITSNSWYYVIGVWNPGVHIKIYLNGVLETTNNTSRTNLRTSTVGWHMARNNNGSYSNVKISDFELYTRVLSDAEILANYNGTKTKYGY